jgi:hypothetical protein
VENIRRRLKMKTFEEYWAALVAKNPAFGRSETEHVTLTVRGIKNVVKQAWERGELSMAEKTATAFSEGAKHRNDSPYSSSSLDALKNLFGMR